MHAHVGMWFAQCRRRGKGRRSEQAPPFGSQGLCAKRLGRCVQHQFGQPFVVVGAVFVGNEPGKKMLVRRSPPALRAVSLLGGFRAQALGQCSAEVIEGVITLDGMVGVIGNINDDPAGVARLGASVDDQAIMQVQVHQAQAAIHDGLAVAENVFFPGRHTHQQGVVAVTNVALEQRQVRCRLEGGFLVPDITLAQFGLGLGVVRFQLRLEVSLVLLAQVQVSAQLGERMNLQGRGVALEMIAHVRLGDET